MDKNFEQTQADSEPSQFNYDWNAELGQRQFNYDEQSSRNGKEEIDADLAELIAMNQKNSDSLQQISERVNTDIFQSLTLLESKEKRQLYATENFYLLWGWDKTNKKRQSLALPKNPNQGVVSLSNADAQDWKHYQASEKSQAEMIVLAAKIRPNGLYCPMNCTPK